MLFAAAGYDVKLYDISPTQIEEALRQISLQLHDLQAKGLLRGSLTVEEQYARITTTNDLKQCVDGAVYVQVLELK